MARLLSKTPGTMGEEHCVGAEEPVTASASSRRKPQHPTIDTKLAPTTDLEPTVSELKSSRKCAYLGKQWE